MKTIASISMLLVTINAKAGDHVAMAMNALDSVENSFQDRTSEAIDAILKEKLYEIELQCQSKENSEVCKNDIISDIIEKYKLPK